MVFAVPSDVRVLRFKSARSAFPAAIFAHIRQDVVPTLVARPKVCPQLT